MAKARTPDDLAYRTFLVTMAGILIWVAVVFIFIL